MVKWWNGEMVKLWISEMVKWWNGGDWHLDPRPRTLRLHLEYRGIYRNIFAGNRKYFGRKQQIHLSVSRRGGHMRRHYSFLMSQKSSCFAAAWDLAPCPHSQCLFCYVLLMPTKFSCLAAAWDLAPCPHFHYLPNDLLHHQAGDRKGKVSNFRWLRDRKIGSGILSSSAAHTRQCQVEGQNFSGPSTKFLAP